MTFDNKCEEVANAPAEGSGGGQDTEGTAEEQTKKVVLLPYIEFYSGIGGWGLAFEQACAKLSQEDSTSSCGTDTASKQSSRIVLQAQRVAAYDHSTLANDLLNYNNSRTGVNRNEEEGHESSVSAKKGTAKRARVVGNSNKGDTKNIGVTHQTPIESLSISSLTRVPVKVWLMSPPCQPYTRNNEHMTDEADPRSTSFLHLCSLLANPDFSVDKLPKLICLENVVRFEEVSEQKMNIIIDDASWIHYVALLGV
jgi:site-specific DNA-cytosine methylase